MKRDQLSEFLECEKWWIYGLLMMIGGFYGAFTYSIRGGVFANAQTANFVLMGMSIGNGNWRHALYYLIPMGAYFVGTVLSERIPASMVRVHLIRWETLLVLIEMVAVAILGFLPETAPFQITQITISFLCSMQYNTFRQAQKIPMATTFCTNHLRQTAVAFHKVVKGRGQSNDVMRMLSHLGMLTVFVIGAAASAALCRVFLGRALWFALIPLTVVFVDLLRADMKEDWNQVPHGH